MERRLRPSTNRAALLAVLLLAAAVCAISVTPFAFAQERWEYEPPREFKADEAATIRQAPDLGSDAIGKVVRGQTMQVTARVGEFYEVPLVMGGVGYIHRLYLTPLGMLTVPDPPPANGPEKRWQAIAYSASAGTLGSAYNHLTLDDAWNAALNACGREDCRVMATSEDGCVAMARGSAGTAGFGAGEDELDAARSAREDCTARDGKDCEAVRTVCRR